VKALWSKIYSQAELILASDILEIVDSMQNTGKDLKKKNFIVCLLEIVAMLL